MSAAAPPAAVPAVAGEEVATAPASSEATAADSRRKQRNPSLYANVTAAEIIDSLPLETRLKGMAAAGTCFEPDPSDIFLASLPKSGTTWLKAFAFATLNRATHSPSDKDSAGVTKFEEAFELFCEGRFPGGPHWFHALEYWHASQRRPDQVLFLRYEDMLGDPVGNLKKLAAFMGCAFSEEDEEVGVLDQIVELCSLENLKSKDVNKNGSTRLGIKSESFFRKGKVGDWKNYMTMDMAARLDKIVEEATRGSGLTFGGTPHSSVEVN